MASAPGKRKRAAEEEDDRKPSPEKAENGDRNVAEEEEEEFYAILRRMREVSRCMAARNISRPAEPVRAGAVVLEDFEPGISVGGGSPACERAAEKRIGRCLDLNAEPQPESVVVGGSAADECTG